MKGLILLLASVALLAVQAKKLSKERVSYEGFKVIEVTPKDEGQVKSLQKLSQQRNLDFWKETKKVGQAATIMVSPDRFSKFVSLLHKRGMDVKIINHNVQRNIDAERKGMELALKTSGKNYNYNTFNRYDAIIAELESLKGRCPSGFQCETYNIGKSIEGRDLRVLRVYKNESRRKGVWMDSLIHAREWIAGATLMKIIENMFTNYGSDSEVTEQLDKYDWYFLPVMNPDGYEYSHVGDRYWRKNVREGFLCDGVDLNRNYDASWMSDGTSDFECLDIYGGPSAASEPETQAVQAEARRLGPSLITWVSVHSFSNLWLTPWGNTVDGFNCNIPDDYADIYGVAEDTANAVMATFGTFWDYGSVCNVLYAASGATIDYVKASAGVKYTFTPELRGTDFVIGADQIQPSFQEVWNGIKAMTASIERRG